MTERTFTLQNKSGLHARPASLFVQTVNRFPATQVTLVKGEKAVNGKSLLSVLSLGVAAGESITVRCAGEQEQEATEALAALIQGGFGE